MGYSREWAEARNSTVVDSSALPDARIEQEVAAAAADETAAFAAPLLHSYRSSAMTRRSMASNGIPAPYLQGIAN